MRHSKPGIGWSNPDADREICRNCPFLSVITTDWNSVYYSVLQESVLLNSILPPILRP